MLFKELIDALTNDTDGGHLLTFHSYYFGPDSIRIPYDQITDDTPVEVVYYWYYGPKWCR